MNETPKSSFRNYLTLIALAIAGPAVFAIYVIAVWGVTADLGFTKSFPWSGGPLSNWMIWLALALLSHLALMRYTPQTVSEK
jgi:TRAP-type C4-dicarboxylate transport system permease small subunit